jgi:peptide/nickel transport system ATP-binding protein
MTGELRYDVRIASGKRMLVDIRDFRVALGKVTFLFGESGIGKSLIARAIYGLLDPKELQVTMNGSTYEEYLHSPECRAIGESGFFVFQEPSTHLNPLMTLADQIREGSLADAPDDTHLLEEMWSGTGANEIAKLLAVYPKPYRPSGGEKQRIFLVMALKKIEKLGTLQRPRAMFVFDEPTGSLDNRFRNIFLGLLLERFRQQRFTALVITHDYSMVSEVTGMYRDLLDDISFRELRLERNGLILNEFQPEAYLGWLKKQQHERPAGGGVRAETPLLRLENGSEVFGQQLVITRHRASKEPSPLEIRPGSLVYLKAPSGTGKTTIVKMLMGLIRPSRLAFSLKGEELTERTPPHVWRRKIWGKSMTMVFQHADEALNPRSTVYETFRGLTGTKRVTKENVRSTLATLYDFEITDDFMRKTVATLSGGQKQRLNLLRSLYLNTDILILDEPLNGLDFESCTKVLAMMKEKQHMGTGMLLISHNEEMFDALIPDEDVYYLHSFPAQQ